MATKNNSVCFCCGSEITAPQFYNGRAYGWSCVLAVAGKGFKRSKNPGVWVGATFEGCRTTVDGRELNTVSYAGMRFSAFSYSRDIIKNENQCLLRLAYTDKSLVWSNTFWHEGKILNSKTSAVIWEK